MTWGIIALAIAVPITLYATFDTLFDLFNALLNRLVALLRLTGRYWASIAAARRARRQQEQLASLRWPAELTPLDFELWCRAWLELQGWQIGLMPAMGFEDEPQTEERTMWLLARRGGRALLLWCPKAPPASGSAELPGFAARAAQIGADLALVVTAVQRPPAFMRAALRHGVRVLHYRDLGQVAPPQSAA